MRRVSRFAPHDHLLSLVMLLIIGIYVWYVSGSLRSSTDLIQVLASVLIFTLLIDGIKISFELFVISRRIPINTRFSDRDHRNLTVVIACHQGANKIAPTIESVRACLPGVTIIVADDASKDGTSTIALKSGAKVLKLGFNRGKVGAIHRALDYVKTKYVLIMDDDMRLENSTLPYGLLDRYDAVAFNVVPTGEGFWADIQRHEYLKSMQIGKNYHAPYGTVLCISGAIGLFRTKRLKAQVDTHSGEFSGEDLERTLLIHHSIGSRGVTYVPDTVKTEVPETLGQLFKQRCLGWNPGFAANTRLLIGLILSRNTAWRLRVDSLYNLLNLLIDPLRIAALPVLIVNPLIFIVVFVLYAMLDFVTWFAMGKKDAWYLILLTPLYGIFSLVTRFIGTMVWLYRETIELLFLKMRHRPDSYKLAPGYLQAFSFALSIILLCGFLYFAADFYLG